MIRGATLLCVMLGALLAGFVFAIKYEVQDLEAEFVNLSRSIDRERQSIHVLTAEWSHLNEPARLRSLAREQLGLEPVNVGRLREFDALPLRGSGGGASAISSGDPPRGRKFVSPSKEAGREAVVENGMSSIQAAIVELAGQEGSP